MEEKINEMRWFRGRGSLYYTACIQDKYMHKTHQAESIVEKFDIYSKEEKRFFKIDIRKQMKQIAKPYTENDYFHIIVTGNEEMYKTEDIFLLFEVLWQLN